jgi:hypothetical protein
MSSLKLTTLFVITIILFGCMKLDKSFAIAWWDENHEAAKLIVKLVNEDESIDSVDINRAEKFDGNIYKELIEILGNTNLKRVSILRDKKDVRFIKNVRLIIDSSGLSTDGCGLTIEFISSDDYLEKLRNHAGYIESIDGHPKWYIVLYGAEDICT